MRSRTRILSAAAVVALHLLLGALLVIGTRLPLAIPVEDAIALFALPPPQPPPAPPPAPARLRAADPPPAGAPPPIVVPPALVRLPPLPPIVAVTPAAPGLGTGTGAADGAGSGDGGTGDAEGDGDGGRGITPAEQIAGSFKPSDIPRSARGAARLSVGVEYAVGPDGRVGDCTITEPSGYPELDAIVCRVIQRRYRFEPARDADGEPITEVLQERENWSLHRGAD